MTFKAGLNEHIRSIHQRKYEISCDFVLETGDLCGAKFTKMMSLKVHKKSVHDKIRDHKCNECGKAFAVKSNLTNHIIAIHDKGFENYKYSCETCGKPFTTNSLLKIHILRHHNEKKEKCHICGNEYGMAADLKKHILGFHEGAYRRYNF